MRLNRLFSVAMLSFLLEFQQVPSSRIADAGFQMM